MMMIKIIRFRNQKLFMEVLLKLLKWNWNQIINRFKNNLKMKI